MGYKHSAWVAFALFSFTAATYADTQTFTYQGPQIIIPLIEADYAPASIYPATIPVSATQGSITDVDVRLIDFTHAWPGDVDILLVSPAGQNAILLSDAGAGGFVDVFDIILDDEHSDFAPDGDYPPTNNNSVLSYKPTNHGGVADVFLSPAPIQPWGGALSVFDGYSANGDWLLYVMDDDNEDGGYINGWSITVTTEIPEPSMSIVGSLALPVLLKRRRSY